MKMNASKPDTSSSSPKVPLSVPTKPYGKIILTLKNCLLPESKLIPTPSQVDGLEYEIEIDQRILGCEMIQTAGILLKLPQVAMATGQVLFQRFYYSKSFVRHAMETTAMGCICLASKIEEAPRRIRDVINVLHHIKQIKGQKTISPMVLDQAYISLKSQVIKAERRVLKELGFCVHVKHPHKIIVMYLQVLGFEKNASLMQTAWNYMNDALRTDLFVRYQPETVACACIYLTSRRLGISLPKSPPWFKIFKVTEQDLQDVSYRILRLYKRPKPNAEELERKVDHLRRQYQEQRSKSRGSANLSGVNTPVTSITQSSNNSQQKSPSELKKEKRALSPRWSGFITRSTNNVEKRKSRSKSPVRDRSPVSKHKKSKRGRRSGSRSRSRSYDNDRKTTKKSSNHRKRRSHSRSSTGSPHNRHSRKIMREKARNRSRSRSPKRSVSYDRYDSKHYEKPSSKQRTRRTSRGHDDTRTKERR